MRGWGANGCYEERLITVSHGKGRQARETTASMRDSGLRGVRQLEESQDLEGEKRIKHGVRLVEHDKHMVPLHWT